MKHTLESRLGLFFALALVVAAVVLERIGAADFLRRTYRVQASFKTVQQLQKDDLVKMAGVEIGRVEEITLEGTRAKVLMKIQQKYVLHTDCEAVIQFAGLMGQSFVSVEGGSEDSPKVLPGGSLNTREQPDLGAIMVKLDKVASNIEGLSKSFSPQNFSTLLGPITDFMRQNSGSLSNILGNMRTVTDNLAQGRGTVGKFIADDSFFNAAYDTVTNLQAASGDLKGMLAKAEGMITNASGVIADVRAGRGSLGKLTTDETLYTETATAMANLREILQKINRGDGSVGKLVNDETLFKNAKLTLQKVEKATESLEDQGPLSVLGIAVSTLF